MATTGDLLMLSRLPALAAMTLGVTTLALHADEISYGQLSGLMTVTGGNDTGAYAIGPEWSDSLGLSVVGRLGYAVSDGAAVGIVLEGGENVFEGILNIGASISDDVSAVLTYGHLRENLELSGSSDREWVSQEMYGLAIDASQYGVDLFYIDSESTASFDGAVTTGIEAEGRFVLSESAILAASIGYQRSDWDDAALGIDEALTGSIDLGVRASDVLTVTAFADHNLSETLYGLGAAWSLGSMSLDVEYVYSDAPASSGRDDDQRVALTLSMPLGGQSYTTRGGDLPYYITASSQGTTGPNLLAEVMRRPSYLPTGTVVRQTGETTYTLASCNAQPANYRFTPERNSSFSAQFFDGTYHVVYTAFFTGEAPTAPLVYFEGIGRFNVDVWEAEEDFGGSLGPYPEFVLLDPDDLSCFRFTWDGAPELEPPPSE